MEITLNIEPRKTTIEHEGKLSEHKTTFIKSMKVNDLIQLIKDGNL